MLLHPIRNNICSSVQQLADVARARALPIEDQQVRIADGFDATSAPNSMRKLNDVFSSFRSNEYGKLFSVCYRAE